MHALSYPLGGKYHIAHGVSNAILLVPVMKFNEPVCRERFAQCYDRCAHDGSNCRTVEEKSAWIIRKLDEIVEESLCGAAIFDEVKDRLKKSALGLSGGQQQRICIARALAVHPEVLLMDEPTSALDPISTAKIEDLMEELKKKYTVITVTHNMQQAARIADDTAFFLLGDLIEFTSTKQLFSYPRDKRTEDYITGRFG